MIKFWTFEKILFLTIFQIFWYEKKKKWKKTKFLQNFWKMTGIVTLTHKKGHIDVFNSNLTFLTHFKLVIRIRKVGSWFVKSILVRFSWTDLAENAHMDYIWSILTVCNQILNFWKILIFDDFFNLFRYEFFFF